MIEIRRLALPDLLLIVPLRHGDQKGSFSETYYRKTLAQAGSRTFQMTEKGRAADLYART